MANDLSSVHSMHNTLEGTSDNYRRQELMRKEIRRIFSLSTVGDMTVSSVIDNCVNCPEAVAFLGDATGMGLVARRYAVSRAIAEAFGSYINGKNGKVGA